MDTLPNLPRLSRYEIRRTLGRGGMGEVVEAYDRRLARTVALKFLPPALADDPAATARFRREAQAVSALDHPHLCTVYDIDRTDDGRLFIAMAYVDGASLKARLAEGPLPLEDALGLAAQIADGLGCAHAAGIVHRDVKPANVMVSAAGQVKLVDFGLAQWGQAELTQAGSTLGTAAYMSPEQARGAAVDARTDVWALGVVLYEMLTGVRPFGGAYAQAVAYAILHEDPAPLASLRSDVPAALMDLIGQALTKDPGQRLPSMAAFLDGLGVTTSGPRFVLPGVGRTSASLLVGRAREQEALHTALQEAHAGTSRLLGVAGEAGIGKTALVEAFLAEVRFQGTTAVSRGQCSERLAGTGAYLPLFDLLDGLREQPARYADGTTFAALLRTHAPWWLAQLGALDSGDPDDQRLAEATRHTSQEQAKRELVRLLAEASARQPLVLLVEDLHWADAATVDLLGYLAAQFERLRVLVVATYRPAEMALAEHPFLRIQPDLVARGQMQEVELALLPEEEVVHYLAAVYPGHGFPAALATLLHERTEGSPLFLVDLVRDLDEQGVIAEGSADNVDGTEGNGTEDAPSWHLTRPVDEVEVTLPDSVRGMIARKVGHLAEDEQRLLSAASVQGFAFDSAVLAQVTGTDEEAVEAQLQALERAHRFVVLDEEGEFPDGTLTLRYRFVHVLYQNELYGGLGRTRRVRLARSTAAALEGLFGSKVGEVAAELAALHEAGRQAAQAVGYYTQAAEGAAGVFAYQEAIQLAQRGLGLLAGLATSEKRDRLELFLQAVLGASTVAIRGYADTSVGAAFMRARELSSTLVLDKQSAGAAAGLFSYYHVSLRLDNAVRLGQEYIQVAQRVEDEELLCTALSASGVTSQFLGEFASATHYFEQTFEVESKLGKPSTDSIAGYNASVYTYGHEAWNRWLLGDPEAGIAFSSLARTKAEHTGDPNLLAHFLGFAGFFYQCRGEADRVDSLSLEHGGIATDSGYAFNAVWASMQQGWVRAQRGDLLQGRNQLHEGLSHWQAMGARCLVPYWLALIAEIDGQLGRPEDGLDALETAFALVEETEHRMWEADLHRLRGDLLLQQGTDAEQAETCYQRALDVARAQAAKSFELRAAMALARLWEAHGRRAEARTLLSDVYGWFTEGFDTRDLQEAAALLDRLAA